MSLRATMDCLTWVHVLNSNGLSGLSFSTLLFVSISDRALFDGSILPQSILGCLKNESRLFEPLGLRLCRHCLVGTLVWSDHQTLGFECALTANGKSIHCCHKSSIDTSQILLCMILNCRTSFYDGLWKKSTELQWTSMQCGGRISVFVLQVAQCGNIGQTCCARECICVRVRVRVGHMVVSLSRDRHNDYPHVSGAAFSAYLYFGSNRDRRINIR